jgi:hypothetical protein
MPSRPVLRALVFASFILGAGATPASADLTGFVGVVSDPASRPALGAAVGFRILVVGVEVEVMKASEDLEEGAPSLTTGMGNLLVQTPRLPGGVHIYGTVGAGLYRERLDEVTETNVGTNVGGGVKIDLAGPLQLRLDYRVFALAGDAVASNPKRFDAGATIGF